MTKLNREEFLRTLHDGAFAMLDGTKPAVFLKQRQALGVDIPVDDITIDGIKGFIRSAGSGITTGVVVRDPAIERAWLAYSGEKK